MSEKPLNEYLAHLLVQANRHVSRQLNAEGVSLDHWRLLKALADGAGPTMTELAAELALQHPTVTKIVDKLMEEALLYRVPDPTDRRKVRMFLSDKGRLLLERQNALVADHEAKVEGSYGNEDAQRLKLMLENFIRQIS